MGERLKELRKQLGITQQVFADRVGVKLNTVAQWESGVNSITEQTVNQICKEFKVNEMWLRTGKDKIFKESTTDEELMMFINDIKWDAEDSFKKRFITAISKLTTDEWTVLEKIMYSFMKDNDNSFTEEPQITDLSKLTVEEKVALYKRELEIEEKKAEEKLEVS